MKNNREKTALIMAVTSSVNWKKRLKPEYGSGFKYGNWNVTGKDTRHSQLRPHCGRNWEW